MGPPVGAWRCCVLRDPQAPTARPSDQAVLWFLAVPCGVQLGSPAGKARHAIPVAAEWLHLEHPLQAVSTCHYLCQHWPRAWPLLDPAVGISGTLGRTEGWGVACHRTPSHIKSTGNNMCLFLKNSEWCAGVASLLAVLSRCSCLNGGEEGPGKR